MSRLLSLKSLATAESKLRAVTRITVAGMKGTAAAAGRGRGRTRERPAAPESIAVVIAGCGGHMDGTDVYEATCTAVHLSKHGYKPTFFARNAVVEELYDYRRRQYDRRYYYFGCSRNTLNESSRLCWDEVRPLKEFCHRDHVALVVPGGHGAEMDLCSYQRHSLHQFVICDYLKRAMEKMYAKMKPMAFISNASILAARVFPGVRLTYGYPDWFNEDLIIDSSKLGADVFYKNVGEHEYCGYYRIFSTPGHLCSKMERPHKATYYDVCRGIGNLVDALVYKIRPKPWRDPVPSKYRQQYWRRYFGEPEEPYQSPPPRGLLY